MTVLEKFPPAPRYTFVGGTGSIYAYVRMKGYRGFQVSVRGVEFPL